MAHLKTAYSQQGTSAGAPSRQPKVRRTVVTRVHEAVKAIALCHNVTPVLEDDDAAPGGESYEIEADQEVNDHVVYQASSPDEVRKNNKTLSE